MQKTIPWILSALLALLAGSLYFQKNSVTQAKDVEIRVLMEKSANLITEANSKLSQAEQKIKQADLRAQQVTTDTDNKIQALASEANDKIQAASLPEVTIAISFRKALLSNGSVAILKNTSSQPTPMTLQFIRASTGQQRTVQVVIDPTRSIEIGEREGWAFLSGDEIKVSQPAHKTMSVKL